MATTKIIEGGGRTLMPGMIDAHTHIMMQEIPMSVAMIADIGYITLVAGKAATDDVDARVYEHSRYGRTGVWAEDGD